MSDRPWLALGWTPGALTGWGTFGSNFARSLHEAGYDIRLPAGLDPSGVAPLDRPLLQSLVKPMDETREGWLFVPLGNDLAGRMELPAHVKIAAFCVFEDSGALDDAAVERLKAYDLLLAPSTWVQGLLQAKGLPSQLFHQGYDSRTYFPAPNVKRGTLTRPYVFSGGKLEFRKGQDIVIEAFRRFRGTPEGKDAVLVTCWDNPWPQTMDGIWLSGYVKGVPTVKNGRADIVSWLEANGIPKEAVIDCGRLSPPEMAQVMRSCDIGVFPSRCEGATNLVLVEALSTGLPCIVSEGHGHDDVARGLTIKASGSVPQGCRLYKSTAGWTETDPGRICEQLVLYERTQPLARERDMADYWSWDVRGPAIAETVLQLQPA